MIAKLLSPFQKFVRVESFSGVLLFIATIIALTWANSPWSHIYQGIWQYEIGISSPAFELKKPLILWINDLFMAVFFFLIGLEIKRELVIGELNSLRKAAFPFFAAVGGMMFPMTVFLLANGDPDTARGWGIPMATDIAFTLAILNILGNRVPLSLKIFLTAFAIVDDIGAVLVIALFYSSNIQWALLAYAFIPLLILSFLAYRGIFNKYLHIVFGMIVWYLFLKAGIHPTVAGVLLAFTVPIRQKIDILSFTGKITSLVERIKDVGTVRSPVLTSQQIEYIDDLQDWTEKVQSPLQQLEHRLHSWVAFMIMPVFALANAGVTFTAGMQLDWPLVINLALALIVGNSIGVSLMSYLGVKLGFAELPAGVNKWQVLGIAFLAGVGFTMSIFISNLAFAKDPVLIDSAKVGILIGSFLSGLTGYLLLRFSSGGAVSEG